MASAVITGEHRCRQRNQAKHQRCMYSRGHSFLSTRLQAHYAPICFLALRYAENESPTKSLLPLAMEQMPLPMEGRVYQGEREYKTRPHRQVQTVLAVLPDQNEARSTIRHC